MKTVVSGIQPTGHLHLGNYLGTLCNWGKMQHEYQCFFPIVNLHAITVNITPEDLRKFTLQTAAMYLACGIDAEKSTIFIQSAVKEHSELAWILSCITSIGHLKRMTQFKDKRKNDVCLGLFSYPVLMAADILLYKADVIPVGDDQIQHIELARHIADTFNYKFNKPVFNRPLPIKDYKTIDSQNLRDHYPCHRIKSLLDATKKMSKSEPSDYSRINLTDTSDVIRLKIKKAKTGSYWNEDNLELENLVNIYAVLTDKSYTSIKEYFMNKGFAEFKAELADLLIDCLEPIQHQYNELIKNQDYLKDVLKKGADKARDKAVVTMKEVNELMGFL